MKNEIMLINLLFPIFILSVNPNKETINELILQEDENVKITLLYFSNADIGDSDWLKIQIENKTELELEIAKASYSLDRKNKLKSGEKIEIGKFGQGNKYDLITLSDYRNFRSKIKPKSSIFGWKNLTNCASRSIDGQKNKENKICVLFKLDFRYKLKQEEFNLLCDNKEFCFEWTNSEFVSEGKLENRLKEIILNPHHRSVNTYVLKDLMTKENIVSKISTEDLIQGVLLREKMINVDENILFLIELSKRNVISNTKIINSFRRRLKRLNKTYGAVSLELQYYWDNSLLGDVLNSKLDWFRVHKILEVNAEYWSVNIRNTKKVYKYLAKSLNFEKIDYLHVDNIRKWSNNVKIISTSRNPDFLNYLSFFLDDETEFILEDWSKYPDTGITISTFKPDLITMRVCDVAFVSILRALNQFEFNLISEVGIKYHSVKIVGDILPKDTINKIERLPSKDKDISLTLFDSYIKLTPELKKKVKK